MSEMFGRYVVERELGRGAMGVVYLAEDPILNRQVAVKTVDLRAAGEDAEFLRTRLLRDARAAAVLKHPNIVGVHDVFEDDTRAYVVMEYVEGRSLWSRLKMNSTPDSSFVLKVLRQMADALDYTHSKNIIHRDIKPANVMLDSNGDAKIMDFGIARIADARTSTPTGTVMGTVEYMAPEQVRGDTVDGRADQFALAAVAYEMLTGSTVFGPHSLTTLTYKIVHEIQPPPTSRNPNLPAGVDDVLGKGLSKVPADRYRNCAEFVKALAGVFADSPTLPAAATQTMKMPVARKSRAGLMGAIGLICVAGVLAVWRPWSRPAAEAPLAVSPATPAPAASTPKPAEKVVAPSKSKTPPAAAAQARLEDSAAAVEDVPPPMSDDDPKAGQPAGPGGPFQRGLQQARANDFSGAVQTFTKMLSRNPSAPKVRYNRGSAYQHLGQFEAAIADYSEAIRVLPKMPLAYVGRGQCLARLQRDAEALADYNHALRLKPDLPNALAGRAAVYLRLKQYKEALADCDRALAINPGFAAALGVRARAKEGLGDARGAAADRQAAELRKK